MVLVREETADKPAATIAVAVACHPSGAATHHAGRAQVNPNIVLEESLVTS